MKNNKDIEQDANTKQMQKYVTMIQTQDNNLKNILDQVISNLEGITQILSSYDSNLEQELNKLKEALLMYKAKSTKTASDINANIETYIQKENLKAETIKDNAASIKNALKTI